MDSQLSICSLYVQRRCQQKFNPFWWLQNGHPTRFPACQRLSNLSARIHELIHWFAQADLVLEATLVETVTRAALGFPAPEPDEGEDGDD